jgi:hypothetical protein
MARWYTLAARLYALVALIVSALVGTKQAAD